MPELHVHLFGMLRVVYGGVPVDLERRKTAALLAYLAVEGRPQGRDVLAALFWPELDEQRAHRDLRRTLFALGQGIGKEYLAADRLSVTLRRDAPLYVDVAHFRDLLAQFAAHNHRASRVCDDCLQTLSHAVALYAGDFMAGFSLRDSAEFDAWQASQADVLRRDLATTLEALSCGLGARGRFEPALAYARRWLALDPLSEATHRTLMQLYAAAGDRSAALRQYEECARILAAELGGGPDPETTALRDLLAQPDRAASTLANWPAPAHNLPPDPTPFVGRAAELARVAQCLGDPACRLLTVVGPGGIGKTRLAIQTARAHLERFDDDVYFVDLTAVSTASLLPGAILSALDPSAPMTVAPERTLVEVLRRRQVLLVLDNCEHLLDGVALLLELLRQAPGIQILATSRVRLNLHREWLLELGGLELPRSEADVYAGSATALFMSCLRRLNAEERVDADDARAIVRICRLLDGMPLGIELAAAWAHALPVREIAAELESDLGVLETTMGDLPVRHRSLQAAFEGSWPLLTPHEQEVLAQLSVFQGGFMREAAGAVAGAHAGDLARLCDASWIRLGPGGRYTMHEAIRQYCAGKLANRSAAGDGPSRAGARHAAYYSEQFRNVHWTRLQVRAKEMVPDLGNAQAAWRWAIAAGDAETVRWMGDALWWAAYSGLLPNALPDLDAAQAQLRGRADLFHRTELVALIAYIQWLKGVRAIRPGSYHLALAAYQEGLDLLADLDRSDAQVEETWFLLRYYVLEALFFLGEFAHMQRSADELDAYIRDDRAAKSGISLDAGQAAYRGKQVANAEAASLWGLGRYAEARDWAERSPAADGRMGEDQRAHARRWLGVPLHAQGEYTRAREVLEEVLAVCTRIGDRTNGSWTLWSLGWLEMAAERYEAARALFERSLTMSEGVIGVPHEVQTLNGLAAAELALGHVGEARRLYERSIAPYREPGASAGQHLVAGLAGLGQAALAEGDVAQATALTRSAIEASHCAAAWEIAEAIAGMAAIFRQGGLPDREAEWLAFVEAWPAAWYQQRQRAARRLRALAEELPAGVHAQATARGRARQLESLLSEALA